jgi:P27 family predicted phage terminase small subunit
MRGRKPKPMALKMFEGNPGKRALNRNEPTPAVQTPGCSLRLDHEAQAEPNRITPELRTLGLLSRIDRAARAAYCQAWTRWGKAEEMFRSTGPVIKSKTTGAIYQNPYLAVANRAMKQMRDFLTEFGMTPASRSWVSSRSRASSDLPAVQDEELEKFFGWYSGRGHLPVTPTKPKTCSTYQPRSTVRLPSAIARSEYSANTISVER